MARDPAAARGSVKERPDMRQRLRRLLRRAIARSWLLSRFWYWLYGLRVEGWPNDEVWYFAYGSNMHDSAFRKRRGMRPLRPTFQKGIFQNDICRFESFSIGAG
jgi:hypothetical protein